MKRRSRLTPLALTILAATGTACSIGAEDRAVVVGPAPDVRELTEVGTNIEPAGPDDPVMPEVDEGAQQPPFATDPAVDQVVLVDNRGELVVVTRANRRDPPHALRALESLLHEPLSDAERQQGFDSFIPDGTRIVSWQPAAGPGVVGVMLSPAFDAGGTDTVIEQRILQVACTVGRAVGATEVELAVGDSPDSDQTRFVASRQVTGCPF